MRGGGSAGPQKLLEALSASCSGNIGQGRQGERAQGWGVTSAFTALLPLGFPPPWAGGQRSKPRTHTWVSRWGLGQMMGCLDGAS